MTFVLLLHLNEMPKIAFSHQKRTFQDVSMLIKRLGNRFEVFVLFCCCFFVGFLGLFWFAFLLNFILFCKKVFYRDGEE